jgi:hypothetical protein
MHGRDGDARQCAHGRAAGADVRRRAPIQHRDDVDARSAQRIGDPKRSITVGGDHHPLATGDAESPRIFVRRTGQHDPRSIIIGEEHGPLEGTGGGHDVPRADLPQSFAQSPRQWDSACRPRAAGRHPLPRAHQAMVINAERQRL